MDAAPVLPSRDKLQVTCTKRARILPMPLRSLRLVATGGTFDKVYDPIAGQLGFHGTRLHEVLAQARVEAPLVEEALQIDSLDMTDAHRALLLERCRAATEDAIVLVHGTDTMTLTARVLGEARLPRTIVLTGAMVPFALPASDAAFNLGFAIACARLLPTGVYVAMNGVARPWDDVRKNRERGVFEVLGPNP